MMNNNKGFTLVELMAVIAILAILLIGGSLAVTSVIQRQKQKLKEDQIKTIEDAAITYVLNKKFYVPVCKNTSGGLVTITQDMVVSANSAIEGNSTWRGKRGNFVQLNEDNSLKSKLSGASGIFGNLKNNKCYKIISVQTLREEGFVEKVEDCDLAANNRYSVIVVYAQGDASDPTGAGQLVAVSDKNICS